MRLEDLFKLAESGGNSPEGTTPDRRQALVYMDVTSSEYRRLAARFARRPKR